MAKPTIIGRMNAARGVLSLFLALVAMVVWFETKVAKTGDLRRIEIASMEDDLTLLLLPYGGGITGAPPEVVATYNVWINNLGRKRED